MLTHGRNKLALGHDNLVNLGDHGLHHLRIQTKTLRYGAELLSSLWPDEALAGDQKSFLADLRHLQDKLGDLHDMAVAVHDRAVLKDPDPISAAQTSAQLGLMLVPFRSGRKTLLRKAARVLARILNGRAWWHVD